MDQIEKEKIKLTVKEILLTIQEGAAKFQEIVGYPWQRREAQKYLHQLEIDKENLYQKLWKLEKIGYIKRYKKDKKTFIELTPIGKEKVYKYYLKDFKIEKPEQWDKKWRMVIFDIPEDKKVSREILRERLKKIGFFQLQKSVFIHPFDCHEIIKSIRQIYCLGKHIQYAVVESIETEIDLLDYFYNQDILNKNDLI